MGFAWPSHAPRACSYCGEQGGVRAPGAGATGSCILETKPVCSVRATDGLQLLSHLSSPWNNTSTLLSHQIPSQHGWPCSFYC